MKVGTKIWAFDEIGRRPTSRRSQAEGLPDEA
jgi:hypothetical protein